MRSMWESVFQARYVEGIVGERGGLKGWGRVGNSTGQCRDGPRTRPTILWFGSRLYRSPRYVYPHIRFSDGFVKIQRDIPHDWKRQLTMESIREKHIPHEWKRQRTMESIPGKEAPNTFASKKGKKHPTNNRDKRTLRTRHSHDDTQARSLGHGDPDTSMAANAQAKEDDPSTAMRANRGIELHCGMCPPSDQPMGPAGLIK